MLVKLDEDHKDPKQSQVIIAITGEKKAIKEMLLKITEEIDAPYGKPIQGIISKYGAIVQVITPVWEGKKY